MSSVLGTRIRELRKARKWSALRLSRETDGAVSHHAIAKLETNQQGDVTLTQGVALARALGVTVESLLDATVPASALAVALEIVAARERLRALLD